MTISQTLALPLNLTLPPPLKGGGSGGIVSMIDFQAIRESIDLTEIAGRYTTLNRYLQGPCPLCGGRDRFYIHNGGQRWGCRRCNEKGGDVIDLVALCHKMSKGEAARWLTGDQHVTTPVPARTAAPKGPPRSALDQDVAAKVIQRGIELLPSSPGLTYAVSRGLSSETLDRYHIGFDPRRFDPRAKVRRPALVIPWLNTDGTISGVKFRFTDASGDLRYTALKGSSSILFGANVLPPDPRVCVVVEGELNALSVAEAFGRDSAILSIGPKGNLAGIAAASDLIRGRYAGVPVVLWLDEEEDARRARRTFGGTTVALKSPRGLDANAILVAYGGAGLRELVMPSEHDPVLTEIAALRELADRVRSKADYLSFSSRLESLYDQVTDEKRRAILRRLQAEAEKLLVSIKR